MFEMDKSWFHLLHEEFIKPYYVQLMKFLEEEYQRQVIYPTKENVFSAFFSTPPEYLKVVILGQDPYHNEKEAHGMCFSILPGQSKTPPSLQNIFKELHTDVGCTVPENGYLMKWAEQGVLLINAVMTVRDHEAYSHKGKGWEQFTDAVLTKINELDKPICYLLWGKPAQDKQHLLTNPKHLILTAPHPSPLSAYRGFFGCKHFSKVNEFLMKNGETPIDWQIENDTF